MITASVSGAISWPAGGRPRSASSIRSGRVKSSARMKSAAPIGITDWVRLTGTQGSETSVSPCSTTTTW